MRIDDLSPEERFEEVAAIFAKAVLRLKRRSCLPGADDPRGTSESAPEASESRQFLSESPEWT